MQSQGPNPLAYLFPAVALLAVVAYFVYGAIDRFGLESHPAEARVTGKQFTPGSTTYTTEVIAGRTMTKANQNPDAYVVALDIGGEATGGMVSPELYESLAPGERVHVKVRRTRLSKRILVTDVHR
jgi:hypothetical protein